MQITKRTAALKIEEYLHHKIDLPALVDWAENAIMDGDFLSEDAPVLRTVTSRLGVADIHQFGLSWEDCEDLLKILGYSVQINIVAA